MAIRNAEAEWNGSLKEGTGRVKLGSGAFEGQYSFSSRFESGTGTNPEELIGAAHAGCFTMALSFALARAGYSDGTLETKAAIKLEQKDGGFAITRSDLTLTASVPGIDPAEFEKLAKEAEANCPVSKVLNAEITLTHTLA